MLRNISQSIKKPLAVPYSLVSLTSTPVYFKSRSKRSRVEKLKRYMQDPKFKRFAKLKMPDLNNPDLTFPITIPIRYRFVHVPIKNKPKLPEHDFINFKSMTGNEILLNLSNADHLRPSELAGALLELGARDGAKEINWNEHEWIAKCVEIITKKAPSYKPRVVSTLIYAMHRLNINEPLLWSSLARESGKTIHNLKAKGFGATFICLVSEPDRCTTEFRERMASLMPVHVKKMNPRLFSKCLALMIREKLMTEYLFEDHFFMMIWRRNHWYGASNYASIIRSVVDYGYTGDLDFWNSDFTPTILKLVDKANADQAEEIIDSLKYAKERIPSLQTEIFIDALRERVVFVNTKLKQIENAKFWNIVKNDLEFYREKEKLKIEKQRA